MNKNTAFQIIKNRHVTEKARVMEQLQFNASNPCVQKCQSPKVVFIVDKKANKKEIASAVEEIYADKKIKVVSVNTVNLKPKQKRMRGRIGYTSGIKKAVVTLAAGDAIDEKV